jgi:putative oxidoreductase
MNNERVLQIARVFLRLALGITFLFSIGDRFGWLGPYGSKNVSWGDWTHFVQYVAVLNSFAPKSLISGLAILETIIELGLGIALLLGIYQRVVAWSSAALLMSFALTMSIALGITAPLGYSVFTALGAALLLGAVAVPHAARSAAATRPAADFMTDGGSDTLPARQLGGATER